METGLLYPATDDKKAKSELESGNAVIGIDARSLLNQLEFLEVREHYRTDTILAQLKKELLIINGVLVVKEEEPGQEEEPAEEQPVQEGQDGSQG